MRRSLSPLLEFLESEGIDGYLIDADASDSDQRYVSGFDAPDPYQTLVTSEGIILLVSELEYGRARSEADADEVCRLSAYDHRAAIEAHGHYEGRIRTIESFLSDHGVRSIAVQSGFPTGTADGLRERGISVVVEPDGIVEDVRSRKSAREVTWIRGTQRANETAMAAAERLLANASVEDGQLVHDGAVLTSERVKEEIEVSLIRDGCSLDDTIVACGADGADPHDRGSGPLLSNEPIVVDIFPRNKETKYFADMTRTFVRGEPSAELRRRYEVTKDAYEAALEAIEPGVSGSAVHDVVCEVIEEAGYPTLRSDPETETGFIHGTGHGVGLDVHESPRLSPGGDELEVGHVVTVEPGIYDPDVGGIRIEDLVLVTEDGAENLTKYPISDVPTAKARKRRVGEHLDPPGL